MNYQDHSPTLRKHRGMTICAEMACVCLIFASLLFGMQKNQLKHQKQDSLEAETQNTQHIIIQNPSVNNGGNYSEVVTGGFVVNGGNLAGSYIEITTDENGNSIPGSMNGSGEKPGYVIIQPGQNNENTNGSHFNGVYVDQNGNSITVVPNYGSTIHVDSQPAPFSTHRNLTSLFLVFLPCVLFLMYLWKFYESPRAKTLILPILFLSFPVHTVVSLLADVEHTGVALLILQGIPALIAGIAFAVLAVRIPKERASKKLVLAGFICQFLCVLLSILSPILAGNSIRDLPLIIIGDLLSTTGMIALTIGLFLFAYWNGQQKPNESAEESEPPTTEPS